MEKYYVESRYGGCYFSTLDDAINAMQLLSPYHQYTFDRDKAIQETKSHGHYGIGCISVHRAYEGEV